MNKIKELIIEAFMWGASCLCDQCYWDRDECPLAELAEELGVAEELGCLDREALRRKLEEIIEVKEVR